MIHRQAITLKQLRALAALDASGTVTAAAQTLSVTPPAVSTQIRLLEANLGMATHERLANGRVKLTPVGRELVTGVTQAERALSRALARAEAIASGASGRVALGVVSTAKYFAPWLVAAARRAMPDLDVDLQVGNREATIRALRDGEVELAIMGRPPREPAVEATAIGDHPHVLIAAPDHRLAGRADLTADELMAETFLTREPGSGTRILMERFLDRIGEGRVYERIELGSNETIKQAVMAGLGVALISGHTVLSELESGRLVALAYEGLPILRQWFLLETELAAESPAAQRLAAFVLEDRQAWFPGALPGG